MAFVSGVRPAHITKCLRSLARYRRVNPRPEAPEVLRHSKLIVLNAPLHSNYLSEIVVIDNEVGLVLVCRPIQNSRSH